MPNIRPLEKKDFAKVAKLFPQLINEPVKFNGDELIADQNANCIVIENDGILAGFGSLITYRVPTKGLVARIEDVIVNESCRGRGYGKLLTQELIKIARDKDIHEINLTSGPQREAARGLYESMGFKLINTGIFHLNL